MFSGAALDNSARKRQPVRCDDARWMLLAVSGSDEIRELRDELTRLEASHATFVAHVHDAICGGRCSPELTEELLDEVAEGRAELDELQERLQGLVRTREELGRLAKVREREDKQLAAFKADPEQYTENLRHDAQQLREFLDLLKEYKGQAAVDEFYEFMRSTPREGQGWRELAEEYASSRQWSPSRNILACTMRHRGVHRPRARGAGRPGPRRRVASRAGSSDSDDSSGEPEPPPGVARLGRALRHAFTRLLARARRIATAARRRPSRSHNPPTRR